MKNLDIQEKKENFCPSKEKLEIYIEKNQNKSFKPKVFESGVYFLYKENLQNQEKLNEDLLSLIKDLKEILPQKPIQVNKQEGIVVISCDEKRNIYKKNDSF